MRKILLFIILLLPITVNAESKIINHLIDAELEIAGGLRVREVIVFDEPVDKFSRIINHKMLSDKWDGSTINFKSSSVYNGYSIENLKVSLLDTPNSIDYNFFNTDIKEYINEFNPKDKNLNYFTNVKNDLGAVVNITNHDKKTVIYLDYTISNVIVVHEDILELNYTFKNLNIGADLTNIRLVLAYPTIDKEYKYWVHGPASGKLEPLVTSSDEQMGIITEFTNLKSDINIRMTLPKIQVGIDIYLNKTNTKAFNEIVKHENKLINRQGNDIKALGIIKYVLIGVSILYTISSVILYKYRDNSIFYSYIALGAIITLFNFIFKYNILYIYFILFIPIIIKFITIKGDKTK